VFKRRKRDAGADLEAVRRESPEPTVFHPLGVPSVVISERAPPSHPAAHLRRDA
jgi:hypothetical protein